MCPENDLKIGQLDTVCYIIMSTKKSKWKRKTLFKCLRLNKFFINWTNLILN